MFGLPDGVPLAGYGPRGSEHAIGNIRAAVVGGVPAVLLANHGVLVFHRTADLAIMTGLASSRKPPRLASTRSGLAGPCRSRGSFRPRVTRSQPPAARTFLTESLSAPYV